MFDWPPTAPVQSLGVTVCADGQIYQAPFIPRSLDGRTGRGDTCFAAYVGQRLSTSPQEAARFAAAVTTLKQEQPGPWRGGGAGKQESQSLPFLHRIKATSLRSKQSS